MTNSFLRRLSAVVAFASLILVSLYFLQHTRSSDPAGFPLLPVPNGYEDFLEAGKLLASDPSASTLSQSSGVQELREFIQRNAEALARARLGLRRNCRVTINFNTNAEAYSAAREPELRSLRILARSLVAEGQCAEMEKRTNDAVRIYLEVIQFGDACARGGVMIDRLVGVACQGLGLKALQRIVPGLPIDASRDVITTLESLEANHEPVTETLRLEKLYVRRMFHWQHRLGGLVQYRALQRIRDNLVQKVHAATKENRQLLVAAAVRAYSLEKAERPKQPADLVPDYLKAVPQDPSTGVNLTLRP